MEIKVRKKKILYYNSILGVWKRKTFVYAMFEILIYYRFIILLVARKNLWRNPRKLGRRRAAESFWTGKLSTFRGNSQRDSAHGMHTSCRFPPQNPARYWVSIFYCLIQNIFYMLRIFKIHLGEGVHPFKINKFKEIMSEVHKLY